MTAAPPFSPLLLSAAAFGLPLVAAAVLAVRPWRRVLCRWIPWAALPALAAAVLLPDDGAIVFRWLFLEARFGLDPTGRIFLFFTAALWVLSGVFGSGYLARDRRPARFFFFYALAMGGNLGLILAQDMIGFYVFFALMSFASYGLVVHTGDPVALRAGRVYMALVVAGEILLFVGMAMLAASAGSLDFRDLRRDVHTVATFVLILAGFGIKAGALPLHVWLPLAHPAAPTPASAVLSGAMIKAGLLGWMRFIPFESAADPSWGAFCVAAGVAGAFYGVGVGLTQSDPKTILAYSSISQMGLITVGFGLSLWNPAFAAGPLLAVALYAMHHAFAKGALFLGLGILPPAGAGTRAAGIAWAGYLLAALSLAGAPLTSGAVAKTALKSALGMLPPAWQSALFVLLPMASAGTTLLMGRLLFVMAAHRSAHGRPPTPGMWVSWVVMLLLVAAPLFVLSQAENAENLSFENLGASLGPLAAGGALAGFGWCAARKGLPVSLPRLPSGDLIVFYSAAVRSVFRLLRLAGAALSSLPGDRSAYPALKECCRKTILRAQSIESSGGDWQTSGLVFLLLVCGLLLVFFFAP